MRAEIGRRPKVYITKLQRERLGPVACEILRLFFEELAQPDLIKTRLSLTDEEYKQHTSTPIFVQEFNKNNARFHHRTFTRRGQRKHKDVTKRLEDLAPSALDELEQQLQCSPSETTRQRAALEILDRAGYVKVEKQLRVTASAEQVIKELNKMKGLPMGDFIDADSVEITPPALPLPDEE